MASRNAPQPRQWGRGGWVALMGGRVCRNKESVQQNKIVQMASDGNTIPSESSEVVIELEDAFMNSMAESPHASFRASGGEGGNADNAAERSQEDESASVVPDSNRVPDTASFDGAIFRQATPAVTTGTPVVVGNPVSMALAMMDQNCCQQCCACSCVPNLDLKSRNQAKISSILLALVVLVQCVGCDVLASKLAMFNLSTPQVRLHDPVLAMGVKWLTGCRQSDGNEELERTPILRQ
eukprot:307128-Hanusia_phi.AAC.1